MTYMKRNVNILLMLLVIMSLSSLVLLTTFYQQNYRDLAQSHEATSDQLNKISQNFTSKLDELNRTTTELETRSSDKELLDDLYSELVEKNKKTEKTLNDTKKLLDSRTKKLIGTETNLSATKRTLTDQEKKLNYLDSKVKNQTKIIRDLEDEICRLKRRSDPNDEC